MSSRAQDLPEERPLMVHLDRVTKRFGASLALQGVNLQLASGKCLGLVGPNGAGKTTLLKILSTLTMPSSGTVTIAGHDASRAAERIRPLLGVLSHRTFLYGHLTASENLHFYGRMLGVAHLAQRIRTVLETVGLEAVTRQLVRTYSRACSSVWPLRGPFCTIPACSFWTNRTTPSINRPQHACRTSCGGCARKGTPPSSSAPTICPAALSCATKLPFNGAAESCITFRLRRTPCTLFRNCTVIMSVNGAFVRQAGAILAKDLKTEWRAREVFTSMFVFTVLVVVVFQFTIGSNPALIREVAAGVLWVALLFATVIGLQRAVQMEGEEDCLQGVLLAVQDRSALFLAKALANMIYLVVVSGCILPLFALWFRVDLTASLPALGVILALGIVGLSVLGTLFSLIVLNIRMREVMLPLLFLPVSVPLLIAAVYATGDLIDGKTLADVRDYIILIGVFDVVFLVLALLIFDYVVEE